MQCAGKSFFELTVSELLTLNFVLSLAFAQGLNSNQLNILGNFICGLGQEILVIQAIVGSLPDSNYVYYFCNDPAAFPAANTDTPSVSVDDFNNLKNEVAKLATSLEKLLSNDNISDS